MRNQDAVATADEGDQCGGREAGVEICGFLKRDLRVRRAMQDEGWYRDLLQAGREWVPVQMVGKISLQDTRKRFHGCACHRSLSGWSGIVTRQHLLQVCQTLSAKKRH